MEAERAIQSGLRYLAEHQHEDGSWGGRHRVAVTALSLFPACRGASYDAMERVGKHKRDILRDRVVAAKDDQRAAEEQFQSAYESFKAVSGYDGGSLESTYDQLNDEYEEMPQHHLLVAQRGMGKTMLLRRFQFAIEAM